MTATQMWERGSSHPGSSRTSAMSHLQISFYHNGTTGHVSCERNPGYNTRVNLDLDRTQNWLHRTVSLRREPPLRGGPVPSESHRRQAAAGIAALGITLICLSLLASRSLHTPVGSTPTPALTSLRMALDMPAFMPLNPPNRLSNHVDLGQQVPTRTAAPVRSTRLPLLTDAVAPSAPVWITTRPGEWSGVNSAMLPPLSGTLGALSGPR